MSTRPFRDWEDLRAMQAVCSARLAASPGRANAHPGDIAWWAGWPPKSAEALAEGFLLLEEHAEVVGFAAWQAEEGDLSVFVTPGLEGSDEAVAFEEEALGWASRGTGAPRWTEFEDDVAAVERWRSRGYRPTDEAYLNMTQHLDDIADDGRDLRVAAVGDEDAVDRASITHAAFGSSRSFEAYVAAYEAFRASPAYPHGWDLLFRDADGRPAACCIAWTDPVSAAGTFEPVATHPRFHRRGFGRALLLEGLRRFSAARMTWAIIGVEVGNGSAESLYRSVGFEPDRVLRVYEAA